MDLLKFYRFSKVLLYIQFTNLYDLCWSTVNFWFLCYCENVKSIQTSHWVFICDQKRKCWVDTREQHGIPWHCDMTLGSHHEHCYLNVTNNGVTWLYYLPDSMTEWKLMMTTSYFMFRYFKCILYLYLKLRLKTISFFQERVSRWWKMKSF